MRHDFPDLEPMMGGRHRLDLPYAKDEVTLASDIVKRALLHVAAKHFYPTHESIFTTILPHAWDIFAGEDVLPVHPSETGAVVFRDAVNAGTGVMIFTKLVRFVQQRFPEMAGKEICHAAAQSIVVLSRAMSNMSRGQGLHFMESMTGRQDWPTNQEAWDFSEDFFTLSRDQRGIAVKPTAAFIELLRTTKERVAGGDVCPAFDTKGENDAYKLLLEAYIAAFKKIERAKEFNKAFD